MISSEKILLRIEEFQTLPTIYTALTEAMNNPNCSATDVAAIISGDQAAAVKVLKAANSPIYGFSGRIDTISKAIMYMGFTEVKNLVAALAILEMFSDAKVSAYFNPVEFWKYSVAVGVIARSLAQKAEKKAVEHYFLAGILHDLGKLLFYQCAPEEFSYALQIAALRKISLRKALKDTIGIPHNILGEILAERWKMPPAIRAVIRYVHKGVNEAGAKDDNADELVAIVHLASIAAQMFGLGSSSEEIIQQPNEIAWKIVHLPDDVFTQLQHQIIQDYEGMLFSLQL